MTLFGKLPRIAPQGFPELWRIWPRKVARKAAERAWKSAVKRADPAVIISGAASYARQCGTDPAFILHASTFLNGDRWNDYCDKVSQEPDDRKMWRARLLAFKPNGYWPQSGLWGPRPGEPGFQGPKDLEQIALDGK